MKMTVTVLFMSNLKITNTKHLVKLKSSIFLNPTYYRALIVYK
jgi:hypothetical protein